MQSEVNKRRAERQKKARKRRLKIAFVFFLIIALITLVIMCFTVFFPIKRINVSGSQIYTKEQIIRSSKLSTDDNLFEISEDEIENKIRKELPYIDSVEIKRVLPDAVILTVVDAKEQAFCQTESGCFIISESGYVLNSQTEIPENVFEIVTSGIDCKIGEKAIYSDSQQEELIKTLVSELKNNKINIDKIDVSNPLQITLSVEDRFTVIVGNSDYLVEKTAHLAGMIESIGDRKGKINLSMWLPQNSQGSFIEDNK